MKLEYASEKEKELRIEKIEAAIDNNLFKSRTEEVCLQVELQFLQGNKSDFNEPKAVIEIENGVELKILYEKGMNRFCAAKYQRGRCISFFYYAETVEALLSELIGTEDITGMTKERLNTLLFNAVDLLLQDYSQETLLSELGMTKEEFVSVGI